MIGALLSWAVPPLSDGGTESDVPGARACSPASVDTFAALLAQLDANDLLAAVGSSTAGAPAVGTPMVTDAMGARHAQDLQDVMASVAAFLMPAPVGPSRPPRADRETELASGDEEKLPTVSTIDPAAFVPVPFVTFIDPYVPALLALLPRGSVNGGVEPELEIPTGVAPDSVTLSFVPRGGHPPVTSEGLAPPPGEKAPLVRRPAGLEACTTGTSRPTYALLDTCEAPPEVDAPHEVSETLRETPVASRALPEAPPGIPEVLPEISEALTEIPVAARETPAARAASILERPARADTAPAPSASTESAGVNPELDVRGHAASPRWATQRPATTLVAELPDTAEGRWPEVVRRLIAEPFRGPAPRADGGDRPPARLITDDAEPQAAASPAAGFDTRAGEARPPALPQPRHESEGRDDHTSPQREPSVLIAHVPPPAVRLAAAHVFSMPSDRAGDGQLPADTELVRQIVQGAHLQWRNGAGEARLTLQPEYLGEVVISLRVEGGAVTATVLAAEPSVRTWMQAHEGLLKQGLANQGLTLDALFVPDDRDENDLPKDRGRPPQQEPARQRSPREGAPVFELDA